MINRTKVISLLLIFFMLLNLFTIAAFNAKAVEIKSVSAVSASDETYPEYEYRVFDDGSAQITGYNGEGGDVTIPSSLGGYTVISIGYSAFSECTDLRSIVISDSVKEIKSNAFRGCRSLRKAVIPLSVTSIGSTAFYECSNLEEISLPDGLTELNNSTFYGCTSLKSIYIPVNVEFIDRNVFGNCTNLSNIVVDPANSVFDSRDNCNAVINTADNSLIVGCKNTVIPDSICIIGESAFCDCTELSEIIIPESISKIEPSAFSGCSGIDKIIIPGSVHVIGTGAFKGCAGLKSVIIEEGVTSIDYQAFSECTNLADISFPDSVINAIDFCEDTPWFNERPNGLVYVGRIAYKYKGDMPADTHIKIKSGTISIGHNLFDGFENLKSVEIPNGVKTIGEAAFRGNTGLTAVKIPDSVSELGGYSFNGCSNLKSIEFSSNITRIGYFALDDTKWLEDQPDGAVYIGNSLYTYKGQMPVNTEYKVKDGTVSLANGALAGKKNMVKVEIPDSVTYIGSGAFEYCSDLETIILPDRITVIEPYTFGWCYSLKEITIPESVQQLMDYSFVYAGQKEDENGQALKRIVVLNKDLIFGGKLPCGLGMLIEAQGTATVYGYKGSTAEEYAKECRMEFVSLVTEPKTRIGDTDCDGDITLMDATEVQRLLLSMSTNVDEKTLMVADVDKNGLLEIVDATYIQRHLAGMEIPYEIGN